MSVKGRYTEKHRNLQKELAAKFNILEQIQKDISKTNKDIAIAKKTLKSKKVKLAAIQKQIKEVDKAIEKTKTIQSKLRAEQSEYKVEKPLSIKESGVISVKAPEIEGITYREKPEKKKEEKKDLNNAEKWVLIKEYNDLVERGVIRPQGFLTHYEEAEYMQEISTEDEWEEFMQQAVDKGKQMLKKSEEKQKKALKRTTDFWASFE